MEDLFNLPLLVLSMAALIVTAWSLRSQSKTNQTNTINELAASNEEASDGSLQILEQTSEPPASTVQSPAFTAMDKALKQLVAQVQHLEGSLASAETTIEQSVAQAQRLTASLADVATALEQITTRAKLVAPTLNEASLEERLPRPRPTAPPLGLPSDPPEISLTSTLTNPQFYNQETSPEIGSLTYILRGDVALVCAIHVKGAMIPWSYLTQICKILNCTDSLRKMERPPDYIHLNLDFERKPTNVVRLPQVPPAKMAFEPKLLPPLPEGTRAILNHSIRDGELRITITAED